MAAFPATHRAPTFAPAAKGPVRSNIPLSRRPAVGIRPQAPSAGGLRAWITLILAVALMTLCSSDRIVILYAPRVDVALALLLAVFTFPPRVGLSISAIIFVSISLVAGLRVGDMEWAIGRSAKLALIWYAARQWMFYPRVHRAMFWTALVMVFMNAFLVLLISRNISWAFGEISSQGRISTFLTMPGVLSRVGLVPICYFLYRLIAAKRPRLIDAAGIMACVLCVWRDGSRTGMLCIVACWLFVMGILLWERRSAKLSSMIIVTVILGIVLPAFLYQFLDSDNPLKRIANFLDQSTTSGVGADDSSRQDLNAMALGMIWEDPLVGHGLGTAILPGSSHEAGYDVVHNVYLQQCVELGIPGLLAIVGVIWGWVPAATRLLPKLRQIPQIHERAYLYNSLFCLTTFGLMKLMHPLSSEWGDWAVFCFAFASILGARPTDKQQRQPSLPPPPQPLLMRPGHPAYRFQK